MQIGADKMRIEIKNISGAVIYSEELRQYHNIYADEIRDLVSRFIVPVPKKTTHCIACGKKIEYEGQCPKKCPDCKGMK